MAAPLKRGARRIRAALAAWLNRARPEQLLPPGDWLVWLLLAGRGFGKTRTGAETVALWLINHAGCRVALVAATFDDGRDTMVEGESGLESVLQRYGVAYTWNRSLGQLVLTNGSRADLYSGEKPRQLRGPQHHYAWCVAAGEPVLTRRGWVPVEQVRAGDWTLTRQGWRRVTAARYMGYKPTLELITEAGSVRVTADHRVWADGRWRQAGTVTPGASMLSCLPPPSPAHPPTTTGTATAGIATAGMATTETAPATCCTGPCGPPMGAGSPRGTTCTTSTMTEPTTTWRTWRHSPLRITARYTRWLARGRYGTPRWPRSASVRSAGAPTPPGPRSAGSVAAPAGVGTVVVAVEPRSTCDVYDLTVDGAHEFHAGTGGLLIHNCDELAWWLHPRTTWDNLLFGLRLGERPRILVSTTPRPLKLLGELVGAADTVMSTGSTMDNAANLPAVILAKLLEQYDGTSLGRQELYGVLALELEGALWSRAVLVHAHASYPLPELDRIVVSVDPAVTSGKDADATGVVVAGRGPAPAGWRPPAGVVDELTARRAPHLYVLHSEQDRWTPNEAMRRAVELALLYGADEVVVEANNGGDYLPAVFLTEADAAGVSITVHTVHATRNKVTRAEPAVALYEQRRAHHIGPHEALEDQQVSYTGGKGEKSPDLMDALVWAQARLIPLDAQRRRKRVPAATVGA